MNKYSAISKKKYPRYFVDIRKDPRKWKDTIYVIMKSSKSAPIYVNKNGSSIEGGNTISFYEDKSSFREITAAEVALM